MKTDEVMACAATKERPRGTTEKKQQLCISSAKRCRRRPFLIHLLRSSLFCSSVSLLLCPSTQWKAAANSIQQLLSWALE